MTGPAVDPTELTPEQWQQYLASARADLHASKDPARRQGALQAIRDANFALGVYDEAAAASPGERIASGAKAGARGLGQAALDIPRGIFQLLTTNPVTTVKNLPKIPGAIAAGLASGDPEQIARTVGNVGSLALPFAKAGAVAKAPAALGRAARAVTPPIVQSIAKKVTPPIITDALTRLTRPRPVSTALPGLLGAGDDIGAMAPPAPVASVTNTPPLTATTRTPLPTGGPLDAPTFMRRASPPQGTPARLLNPLAPLGSVQFYLKMSAKEFQAAKAQLAPEVWNELARLRAAR